MLRFLGSGFSGWVLWMRFGCVRAVCSQFCTRGLLLFIGLLGFRGAFGGIA